MQDTVTQARCRLSDAVALSWARLARRREGFARRRRCQLVGPFAHSMRQVLSRLMIRHEKDQPFGFPPRTLLTLPPKNESMRIVEWDDPVAKAGCVHAGRSLGPSRRALCFDRAATLRFAA